MMKKRRKRKKTIAVIWSFFSSCGLFLNNIFLFFPFEFIFLPSQVVPGCAGVKFHSVDAENAEDRSYYVHQSYEAVLLQSVLNSKDHGDHQKTRGKEELTNGVVLKHDVAVTTVSEREATCQNF